MEKFKISDIQEIFTSDVERFHSLTQQYVAQLLNEDAVSQEALDEALRQCHTLKGLAATVEAWGLSCLGADFEKLLELAGSWSNNERPRANEVFQFILDHMQDWFVMNQFTCMDMLAQAWDVYQGLRVIMDERWPGYLPVAGEMGAEAADARYVRLTELEILEVEGSAEPVAEAAAVFNGAAAEVKEDLDVQGAPIVAQPIAQSGAPLPVRVVPPTLRHREAAKVAGADSGNDSEAKPSKAVTHADQPAVPKPLQVVPPTLRRRNAGSQEAKGQDATAKVESAPAAHTVESTIPIIPVAATSAAQTELPPLVDGSTINPQPSTTVTPPAEGISTPPLLRVAPPALKRRGKVRAAQADDAKATQTKSDESRSTSALPPEMPTEQLTTSNSAEVTAPIELTATEPLSAEDIFAALPETMGVELTAAPAETSVTPVAETMSEEFTPSKDADLLQLLSQEVAGYLTELTASLAALAGNLAAQEPWEQTRRLFHTIKGTAATFGLDTVSAPAKAAEARCLVAVDDVSARNHEAFESCVHRAATIARALHLAFDEGRLHEAVRAARAVAANAAAANAPLPVVALDPELVGFFINDTRDQIGIIEQAVLRWERLHTATKPGAAGAAGQAELAAAQLQAAQRGFHTIKGAGNSIGLTAVALSVHEVEAFLEGLADKAAQNQGPNAVGSKAIFTFLLGAVDQLRRYLVGLAKNAATPWRHDWSSALRLLSEPQLVEGSGLMVDDGNQPASTLNQRPSTINQPPSTIDNEEEEAQTIRIETARLYQLMNLISEMVIDRARLARKIEQLAGLHRALAERNGALTGSVLNFQEQFEFNLMQQAAAEATEGGGVDGSGLRVEGGNQRPSTINQSPSSPAKPGQGEFSELEFDRYDQFNVLARSLVEISHDIEQLNGDVAACLDSFTAENAHFTHTSQELQSQVTSLGLVPVKTLFPRLQRAFRDALDVEGKEAELVLAGGEAMLDKVVVDKVYAPLLHLLRNAVSHGIEDAATREQRKKPARGKVRLSAAQLSNQIVLQLSDDGAGVDAVAVRERAIAKGWLAKESPELSVEEVVGFIFRPGFSTASKVTSVSGRGIGLDVVRQEVENLNGAVELKFVPGEGATWTLRLPLTLSISEAILAEVGGTQYAFPLNFVEAGLILEPERLSQDAQRGLELYPVERRNLELGTDNAEAAVEPEEGPKFDLLPVLRLSRLFGVAAEATSSSSLNPQLSTKGLIASVGDRRAIVVVDVVLRRQEIVVKQLDVVMAQHPLLNGASVDAEGRVIPILNLPTLLKFGEQLSHGRGRTVVPLESVKRAEQTRVLVVDDSLSVRKVQERYLRDLGCQVTVASDGLMALEKLREQEFDLIFTDLEMPRLNGYELISELRGNPAWSQVPVVVISSRGADKYITKAMNLGASTFLSKPFTQQQLKQVLGHYAKG